MSDFEILNNQLKDILRKVTTILCNVQDATFGTTELSPPVLAPSGGQPNVLINLSTGVIYYWDGDSWESYPLAQLEQFGIEIDGQGIPITDGYKTRIRVPYSGTILGFTLLETSETPIAGDIVIDVKKGVYADYDASPVFASIAGSELPTLTNAVAAQDVALSTWTTTFVSGDLFEFTVSGAADVEKIYLAIHTLKT